jgi:uncharacterized protein YecE (DUF72 family)
MDQHRKRDGAGLGDTQMPELQDFDDAPANDLPPQAARLAPKLRALAERGIYFGTSSWKYEGWLGSIYSPDRYVTRGKHSKKKFEESCLSEYAKTFPTVCGDFAFYQFPTEEYWGRLFKQTPADFSFSLKVPEDITVSTWPKHARYGTRAGQNNEHFLDAKIFERFFTKRLEPYQNRVGPLIFEFGTFNKSTFPTPADFMAKLEPFLGSLPEGYRYGVEIRNSEYLSPEYFDLLSTHNVAHVFNAWTRMPTLDEQVQLPAFTADFTVVRALLRWGRSYEQAVTTFEPYRLVQEPNEGAREGMAEIVRQSRNRKTPAFVFVNNRLEGNAPSTIEAVVGQLGG